MTAGTITNVVHQGDVVELLVRDGAEMQIVRVQWNAPTCSIAPGDQLWWLGEQVFWSSRDRTIVDRPLWRMVV